MVHDKTGPDRKKLDRRNARQQPIKFKDSGFRTGKMLKVAPYSFMTARVLMMRAVVICARSHEIVGFS